jgi:hypothetical protein
MKMLIDRSMLMSRWWLDVVEIEIQKGGREIVYIQSNSLAKVLEGLRSQAVCFTPPFNVFQY